MKRGSVITPGKRDSSWQRSKPISAPLCHRAPNRSGLEESAAQMCCRGGVDSGLADGLVIALSRRGLVFEDLFRGREWSDHTAMVMSRSRHADHFGLRRVTVPAPLGWELEL